MLLLAIGLLLFLGTHSVRLFADNWRSRTIARIGLMRWKALYALVSALGLGFVVWGYAAARTVSIMVWQPPRGMAHLTTLLTLLAFVLIAAAYVPGTHIKARIGHPMLAGVKAWALGHLLANGMLVHVLLFGSFLAWATAAFISSRRRDRSAGTQYPATQFGRDAVAVTFGTVLWAVFLRWGHAWLIGVAPLG